MKRLTWFLLVTLMLLAAVSARAEISANLQISNTYNSGKRLVQQDFVDAEGNLTYAEDKGYARVRYTYNGPYLLRTSYYDAEDQLTDTADGWAEIVITRNGRHQVTEQAYLNAGGDPVPGPDGWARVAGIAYDEYDEWNNTVLVRYYGTDGELTLHKNGYAVIRRKYNENKKLIWCAYSDAADQPIPYTTRDVYYQVAYEYDAAGNTVREQYFDGEGQPMLCNAGYAEIRRSYDEEKRLIRIDYYGTDGAPILSSEKVAGIGYEAFDEWGNSVLVRYYGTDGELTLFNDRYAVIRRTYDERKNLLRCAYFDAEDKPVRYSENDEYFQLLREYDDANNVTLERYLDAEGQPMPCKAGYASVRRRYNENRKVAWCALFDAEDKPVLYTTRDIYYQIAYEYDAAGNTVREQYFDGEGQPMLCSAGYAEVRRTYDEKKRVTRIDYYGTDGAPILSNEQVAGIAYDEYDEWNNTVLVRYYGTDGSLTLHKNGYAVIRRKYNENKKLIWCAYSDAADQPIPYTTRDIYYQIAYEYDAAGNTVREQYFDGEGQPMLCNAGYAEVRRTYDDKKRVTRIDYYGTDGAPILSNEQVAGIAYDEYDEWNNAVLVRYYGTDGSLTLHKNGYAVIRRKYNENKKLIWCAYSDAADRPIPYTTRDVYYQIAYEYDAAGNTVREQYFDGEGKPMLCNAGYAEVRCAYDDQKRVTRIDYFGTDGAPILSNEQVAGIAYDEYDEWNNAVLVRYYGTDGRSWCHPGQARHPASS